MSAVTSVYRNVRSLRTAIKDVGRLRHIAGILTKHGFGALVTQLQLTDVIGIRSIMTYGDDEQKTISFARRLRLAVQDLGPTFVKLGQIVSTRSDIIPEAVIAEFQGLQDRVPPMPWEDVEHQVNEALGRPLSEVFEDFSQTPLASASIAQVHRAQLVGGQEVVVKVQRRGISKDIASDLNILQFLAARAEQLVPELGLIDPVGIVEEFERAINKELDFGNELANIERFKETFADFEGVEVPDTYPEQSNRTMLTMEFVRGVKITEAPEKVGADPYKLAPVMLRALFKMVFEDGVFHGDLHPGNILITDDHTIYLIDFGLVGRLLPKQREDILDILVGLSREDYELIARTFFDLGIKEPGVRYDYDEFQADVVDVIENNLTGKTLSNIDVQVIFADLVNGAIKHQIKMPPTYTMVFKALMTVEGIGKTLAPDVNFIEEAKPFVKDMLLERYSPERLLREGVETLTSTSRFLRTVSQAGPRLLRELEMGNLSVNVDSERFDFLQNEIRRSTNRLTRALVFGSAAVSGTLALDAPGMKLLGISVLSFGAFVVAGLAGLPLIFSLLSRR